MLILAQVGIKVSHQARLSGEALSEGVEATLEHQHVGQRHVCTVLGALFQARGQRCCTLGATLQSGTHSYEAGKGIIGGSSALLARKCGPLLRRPSFKPQHALNPPDLLGLRTVHHNGGCCGAQVLVDRLIRRSRVSKHCAGCRHKHKHPSVAPAPVNYLVSLKQQSQCVLHLRMLTAPFTWPPAKSSPRTSTTCTCMLRYR